MSGLSEVGDEILRLAVALAAGGLLGWERQLREKPAGLRTNMIVSLGSALLAVIGVKMSEDAGQPLGLDLSRIIQGIVGGIGFLGAGTIIQSRRHVEGLTTASTLWLSSALGICSGLGYYALTGVAVVMGVLVLAALGALEARLTPDVQSDREPVDPGSESRSAS